MEYILYIYKFLLRIRWWVIFGSLIITLAVIYATRNMSKTYTVEATLYTGVVSGYTIQSESGNVDWAATNNSMDNLINIIQSETTLKRVSYRLYARNMIHGDSKKIMSTLRLPVTEKYTVEQLIARTVKYYSH